MCTASRSSSGSVAGDRLGAVIFAATGQPPQALGLHLFADRDLDVGRRATERAVRALQRRADRLEGGGPAVEVDDAPRRGSATWPSIDNDQVVLGAERVATVRIDGARTVIVHAADLADGERVAVKEGFHETHIAVDRSLGPGAFEAALAGKLEALRAEASHHTEAEFDVASETERRFLGEAARRGDRGAKQALDDAPT